jgi:hypothetical protein
MVMVFASDETVMNGLPLGNQEEEYKRSLRKGASGPRLDCRMGLWIPGFPIGSPVLTFQTLAVPSLLHVNIRRPSLENFAPLIFPSCLIVFPIANPL